MSTLFVEHGHRLCLYDDGGRDLFMIVPLCLHQECFYLRTLSTVMLMRSVVIGIG
jgi:hypothetical protein